MSELEIRRRPVQERSAKTFDHILETAGVVLEETGWDGFSTNLLAERAGIGIQTLYRYFPNKLSVVATLAKRLIEEWDSWFLELGPNWLGRSGIDLFVERLKNQPGGVAIRRAMAASPILKALDREDNQRLAEQFAGDLIVRDSTLDYDDMVLTILVALEAVVAVVDLTYDLPSSKADRMIELCVEMQGAYLARHVPVRIKEVQ